MFQQEIPFSHSAFDRKETFRHSPSGAAVDAKSALRTTSETQCLPIAQPMRHNDCRRVLL